MRWLELIPAIMERVGMYATTGREMQIVADRLLADLCFLDGRESDWEQVRRELSSYGKLGVAGPFEALFGSPRCQAEVASVYAEVFHRFGYLDVDNPVSQSQWKELIGGLQDRFEDRDVRRSEAEHMLGPPSIVVDRTVLCYTAMDPAAGWLFVDCHAERVRRYDAGHGRYAVDRDADLLVRSVRPPGLGFEARLILTLYGKTLRWGPGWWVDPPQRKLACTTQGDRESAPPHQRRRPVAGSATAPKQRPRPQLTSARA